MVTIIWAVEIKIQEVLLCKEIIFITTSLYYFSKTNISQDILETLKFNEFIFVDILYFEAEDFNFFLYLIFFLNTVC